MLALLLALALPASAAPAPRTNAAVAAVFEKIDALYKKQYDQDAGTITALDRQIESLAPAVTGFGWRAVSPLTPILQDRKRPLKIRLYALTFMGLTHDALALAPLKLLLQDPLESPILRSAAAENLPLLGLSREALRRAFCPLISEPRVPAAVLTPALIQLSSLGCDDAPALERLLRGFGLRPRALDRDNARRTIAALGRSRPLEGARALLRLLDYYPRRSPEKQFVLEALWKKRQDLLLFADTASGRLLGQLQKESSAPANALALMPLLSFLQDQKSVPLLLKLLDHPDAAMLAGAADTLADLHAAEARAPLQRVIDSAHLDARMAPSKGAPPPQALLERLSLALRRLPPIGRVGP
ncbi:MAG: hypothetical protein AAB320_04790 [Elusimicrobiota bacterium]